MSAHHPLSVSLSLYLSPPLSLLLSPSLALSLPRSLARSLALSLSPSLSLSRVAEWLRREHRLGVKSGAELLLLDDSRVRVCRLQCPGVEFRVSGLGFRVEGLELRVES